MKKQNVNKSDECQSHTAYEQSQLNNLGESIQDIHEDERINKIQNNKMEVAFSKQRQTEVLDRQKQQKLINSVRQCYQRYAGVIEQISRQLKNIKDTKVKLKQYDLKRSKDDQTRSKQYNQFVQQMKNSAQIRNSLNNRINVLLDQNILDPNKAQLYEQKISAYQKQKKEYLQILNKHLVDQKRQQKLKKRIKQLQQQKQNLNLQYNKQLIIASQLENKVQKSKQILQKQRQQGRKQRESFRQAQQQLITDFQQKQEKLKMEYYREANNIKQLFKQHTDQIQSRIQQFNYKLSNNYNDYQHCIEQKQLVIKQLEAKLQDQRSSLSSHLAAQRQELKRRYEQKQTKISSQRNNLIRIIKNIASIILGRQYSVVENDKIIDTFTKKINKIETKISSLALDNSRLKDEKQKLQRQLRHTKFILNELNMSRSEYQLKTLGISMQQKLGRLLDQELKRSIQLNINRSVSGLNELKDKQNEMRVMIEQQKRLRFQRDELQVKLREKQRLLIEHKQQYSLLWFQRQRKELDLKEYVDTYKHQLEDNKLLIDQYKLQIQQLNTLLKIQKDNLSTCITECADQKNALARLENTMRQERDEYELSLDNLTKANQHLKWQISKLQQEISILNENNQQKQNVKQQINNLQLAINKSTEKEEYYLSQLKHIFKSILSNSSQFNSLQSIIQTLKAKYHHESTNVFAVSPIFATDPHLKPILLPQISKFTQSHNFSTSFLYRYDEHHKNFSNYLPIKEEYTFMILCRSKKGEVFGVISLGLGRLSRAMIFNLDCGNFRYSNVNESWSIFESNLLIFGNNEIRMKNNSGLLININTRIFGKRIFNFKLNEILRYDSDGEIELDSFQIHRIHH